MSNFKCDKCATTLIDCGLGVLKTPREIELERKLDFAEEALQYYADGEDMSEAKMQGSDAWRYIVDDNHTDIAQQALQKMKEVK